MNTNLVFDGVALLLRQLNDPVDDLLWEKNDSKGKFNNCAEQHDTKSLLVVTVYVLILYSKMKGWRCIS